MKNSWNFFAQTSSHTSLKEKNVPCSINNEILDEDKERFGKKFLRLERKNFNHERKVSSGKAI